MRLIRTICLLTLLLVNLVPATLLAAQASSQIYGPVSPKETLSEIAQKARGHWRIPLKYVVQAMYELNPHAFTDNDINRLHIGSLLIIPDMKALSEEVPELLPSVPEAPPASKIQSVTDRVVIDTKAEQPPQLLAQHITNIDNLLASNRNIIASLQKLIGQINGFQQGTENLQRQISEIKQQLQQVQTQEPRQAQAIPQDNSQQQQITDIRQQLQQQIEEVKTQLQLAMNKMQLLQRQQAQTDQLSQASTASQNTETQSQIGEISKQLQALQEQQSQAAQQPQSTPETEALQQQITEIRQQLLQLRDQQNQPPAIQTQTMPATGELQQQIKAVSEQLQLLQEQQNQPRPEQSRSIAETEALQRQITDIAQQLQLARNQIQQFQNQQTQPQPAPPTINTGQAATTLPPWMNRLLQDYNLGEAELYLILSGIAIVLSLIAIVVGVKASRSMPTLVTVTPTQSEPEADEPEIQNLNQESDYSSTHAPASEAPPTDTVHADARTVINEPEPVETTLETAPLAEADDIPAVETEQPTQAEAEHVDTTLETAPLEMHSDADPAAIAGTDASAELPAEPESDTASSDTDSSEQLTADDIDSKLSWAYLHLDMGDVEQASITLDEIDLVEFPQFTGKVQEIRKLLTMYESNLSSEEKMHQETTVDWDLELVIDTHPEPADTDSGMEVMSPEVAEEDTETEQPEQALELETALETDQDAEPEATAEIPAASDANLELAMETEADALSIAEPALEIGTDNEPVSPDEPGLESDASAETIEHTEPALELDTDIATESGHELEFDLPSEPETKPEHEAALEFELPDELETVAESGQQDSDTDLGFDIETPELELPPVNELSLEPDETDETTATTDSDSTPSQQETRATSTPETEPVNTATSEPPSEPEANAGEDPSGKARDSKFDNTMTNMHTLLEASPSDALKRVLQQQIKLANTYYGKDEFKKAKTYLAKILRSGTPEYRGKALSLLNLVELKQAKVAKSRAAAKPPEKEIDTERTVMINPQSLPAGQSADETEIPLDITGYHELIPKNLSTRFSEYAGNDQGTSLALAYLFLDIDDPKSAAEILEEVTRGSDKSLTNKAHKILEELFVS